MRLIITAAVDAPRTATLARESTARRAGRIRKALGGHLPGSYGAVVAALLALIAPHRAARDRRRGRRDRAGPARADHRAARRRGSLHRRDGGAGGGGRQRQRERRRRCARLGRVAGPQPAAQPRRRRRARGRRRGRRARDETRGAGAPACRCARGRRRRAPCRRRAARGRPCGGRARAHCCRCATTRGCSSWPRTPPARSATSPPGRTRAAPTRAPGRPAPTAGPRSRSAAWTPTASRRGRPQPDDDPEHLDPAAMRAALEFGLALVHRLDAAL